jgi:hypothetical protein
MELTKRYELAFDLKVVYTVWVSSSTVIAPATSMDIEPVVGGIIDLSWIRLSSR